MDRSMDTFQQLVSDHPWSSLSTITAFDSGEENDTVESKLSTESMDDSSTELIRGVDIIGLLKAKASTPISLLVESLVQQLCALLEPDSIKATKLYNVICEKLYEMKLIDESYSMEEFEVMRNRYQKALYQLVGVAKGSDIPKTIQYMVPSNNKALDSRYSREFTELAFLGGGGFGQVYKARHRLDGNEYAVKKICICADSVKAVMTHLKEVKTFAILNHPNVVQYKAAWLEPFVVSNVRKPIIRDEFALCNTDIESFNKLSDITAKIDLINKTKKNTSDSDSDFRIEFRNSTSDSPQTVSDKSLSNSTNSFNQICCLQNDEIRKAPKSEWVTLYIQMALCQMTLKQWLEQRNHLERANKEINSVVVESRILTARKIFKQLVSGLAYIHSKGIVHHDIKPSNVFISIENNVISVQLGDFGLACPLEKSHNGAALGTYLYAAPEQLEGKCDLKSDIFSLGIILLELIESFATDMERVQNITELRKGRLSAHISADHPQFAHIISQLVTPAPSQRPDAAKLLTILDDETNNLININLLQEQLKEKDCEIQRLKALLNQIGGKS
ncbi:eukaryotic translation initiation factor 2-alpha kinase 1-like [Chrysoperla carnea]|uniref:eukaryotic translation initiation factor 2-alpha kinase 1-like n=1 Tax=Chrysoperla carnea TaxID=189513 RepID=UPI001D06B913|nr:eukaryotic translation initiation factor 2-alpha kinase 1-like [Chrysoperla carnea]